MWVLILARQILYWMSQFPRSSAPSPFSAIQGLGGPALPIPMKISHRTENSYIWPSLSWFLNPTLFSLVAPGKLLAPSQLFTHSLQLHRPLILTVCFQNLCCWDPHPGWGRPGALWVERSQTGTHPRLRERPSLELLIGKAWVWARESVVPRRDWHYWSGVHIQRNTPL